MALTHIGQSGRLTDNQIAWAASHDWFFGAHNTINGAIYIADRYTLDGYYREQVLVFTGTFTELRAWAGY